MKYNILYENQFGFQKHKSTSDAILKFTDFCYSAINNQEVTLSVFLDFSKAFDTIDHDILLKKLELYGIRGHMNSWFKSYLSNRRQYVEINEFRSPESQIKLGVPQGSILGPILFLLYISDLYKSSNKLNFVHFADDSTVYSKGKNINDLVTMTNQELSKVEAWLNANRLSLNVNKSACSFITNKNILNAPAVQIRNQDITLVDKFKFLGVTVDNKLSFKDHISNICSKISRSYSILFKLSHFIPSQTIKKLYYSMVYPFITYALEVWGKSCKTQIKRVKNVMNKCVKLLSINNSSNNADYLKLNLLQFDEVYKFFVLNRLFKYINNINNNFFKEKARIDSITHSYSTRSASSGNYNIPLINSSITYKSFYYNAIKLWNDIPQSIKNQTSTNKFRKYIRANIINSMLY